MEERYIHEEHTVHYLRSPIIFCPKRRKKVLVGPGRDRWEPITGEVAQEHDWQLVELAIQPDQVQLIIQTNPSTLPTAIPRLIKGRSSPLLREEVPHLMGLPSLGTHATFSSTSGFVSQEITQKSLERQRKS